MSWSVARPPSRSAATTIKTMSPRTSPARSPPGTWHRIVVPVAKTFQYTVVQLSQAAAQVKGNGVALGFLQERGAQLMLHNSLPLIVLAIGLVFTPLYYAGLSSLGA